jgi:hypothetical protein
MPYRLSNGLALFHGKTRTNEVHYLTSHFDAQSHAARQPDLNKGNTGHFQSIDSVAVR